MTSLLRFNKQRWRAFVIILGVLYFLLYVGVWGVVIPFIGVVFFLASLMLWYIPGILFNWTGFFEFHEFGASPTGLVGHAVIAIFYACAALLISWPFGRVKSSPAE